MYYKLRQACVTNWGSFVLLQIRAKVVTNWDSFIITNQIKCCYKLGQLLQIRATVITNQGSFYKLRQNVLQIGVGITNQGNYYKLGHNSNKSQKAHDQSRSGFLTLSHPLANFEIQKYYHIETNFNGVYSRNNLLKIKDNHMK